MGRLCDRIEENPKFICNLECPVFHIDEASMVDVYTMYKVLKAFEGKPIRLVLIGDWAQLPPIGPGIIFHKLIHSKSLPNVKLTKNFRSKLGIAQVAQSIKDGVMFTGNSEVELIEYDNPDDLFGIIETMYLKNLSSELHVVAV